MMGVSGLVLKTVMSDFLVKFLPHNRPSLIHSLSLSHVPILFLFSFFLLTLFFFFLPNFLSGNISAVKVFFFSNAIFHLSFLLLSSRISFCFCSSPIFLYWFLYFALSTLRSALGKCWLFVFIEVSVVVFVWSWGRQCDGLNWKFYFNECFYVVLLGEEWRLSTFLRRFRLL